MDRISAILPQMGWSPLSMPQPVEHPPATTVEAVSKSTATQSGMGANVDTQTSDSRARAVLAMIQTSTGDQVEALSDTLNAFASTKAVASPPTPDGLVGPRPTFAITPMEARAAELSGPPPPRSDRNISALATAEPSQSATAPANAATTASTSAAVPQNLQPASADLVATAVPVDQTVSERPKTPAVHDTASSTAPSPQLTGWQSMETATQGNSLDLLR